VRASDVAAADLAVAVLAVVAAALPACSPRVLTVVDPCGVDGAVPCTGMPPDPLLDGLVGWWRFDDGVGSPVARDSSGQGNDGTLVDLDTSSNTWQAGRSGSGLEIGGAGYVQVPLSESIASITDRVTMAAWIYFEGSIDSNDMYGTAISREIGTTIDQHYHLSLYIDSTPTLFITTKGVKINRLNDNLQTPRFTWTHLAGTFDGTTLRIYVNGALGGSLMAQSPGAFASDTTPLILGANGNGATYGVSERFPGRIDEIMLYGRVLSSDEIGRLVRLELPAAAP
jgi:hypothetical protein